MMVAKRTRDFEGVFIETGVFAVGGREKVSSSGNLREGTRGEADCYYPIQTLDEHYEVIT